MICNYVGNLAKGTGASLSQQRRLARRLQLRSFWFPSCFPLAGNLANRNNKINPAQGTIVAPWDNERKRWR